MFSWGEDFQQGFRLKKGSAGPPAADGVQSLQLSFHVADLCVGLRVLAFIKDNGEASIIRVSQNASGRREKGKQKFVKCVERLEAVSCTDDGVTLLSDTGVVFYVDSTHPPYTPSPMEALKGIRVTQIACGSQHTVVLSKDGQVYTWGQDSRGQLGLGKDGSSISSPQHVRSLSSMPLVQVSAGGEQSFALSESGSVFGWGRNDCGQLGLGDTTDRSTPTLVHHLNMKKTVFAACGKDHTAVLTTDGVVFTFGSGQHGQLGHNSFGNELRPRLVAELWGSKVTKIACGRYHTLVLTDHMKVYSFGSNEQGQLGPRQEGHPCVPLPVQLLEGTTEGPKIQSIFAGGDSSFGTCRPDQEMQSESKSGSRQEAPVESQVDRWISEWGSKLRPKVKQEIHQRFSSASSLNRSFLNQSNHFHTSAMHSGLDLSLCKRVFKKLMHNEAIQSEVEKAVMEMLPSLHENPAGVEGLRVFLILNELLYAMQRSGRVWSVEIAVKVAAAVQSLSTENLQVTANWWTLSMMENKSRHVKVWRTALSEVLRMAPAPLSSVKDILQILQNMYNVNKRKIKIPELTFCSEIDPFFLEEDLNRWRSRLQFMAVNNPPLILCSFAFVMDFKSKQWVFQLNSNLTVVEHLLGRPVPSTSYFELNLRRSSLVEDSFRQLAQAAPTHIKKGLVVYFDGDTKITNVYKKDFFHHLFVEIKKEKSEMFMTNDSETLAWFSNKEPEKIKADVYLLGLLCGLALYNDCIFPVPFPLVLFKKLLGVKPTLEDLMEFCPEVGKSLQYIMNYEDDDLEDQYMFFEITWKDTNIDLDPENPGKPVTSQNKKEFVDAYVNYVFNKSVESVFQEFERGFFQLCDRDLLRMFEPEELQRLMVGQDDYDWEKLKQSTQYDLPLSPNGGQLVRFDSHLENPTMQMFWEVFDELTEDQKRDFLWFVTGSRKAPILGMGQIQMIARLKIIMRGSPDQHLPESLTCHNILELPSYSSKEIMKDRLTQALIAERTFSSEEERPSV
ncbi:probable E3 ubiquitin-protein ligase HERC4 [Oryzias melastigma]|uniref:Probable E3 ubiquitin-protein ligase HERC4 n=1 Tax=Oryzias melastigma TaxID=30732 RepID=A0A3B3BZK0_ORYME|nr:probable E3 ubiquitin-protein ligase HERC4 [Oryzias melastigma]